MSKDDIDDRLLTPDAMGLLADRLEDAIERIERWGVRIHNSSRLPEAVRVLRSVQREGVFPESHCSLAQVAHAARDAQDFGLIGNMLGTETLPPVVRALEHAVSGVLGKTPDPAYQFQSELWVGAMLTCATDRVGVIGQPNGRSPDFVVEEGTMQYSVEVTRPSELSGARKLVSEKAKQLLHRRYHGGVLVVDLTDCLAPELALGFGTGPPDLHAVQANLIRLTNTLRQQVFDDRSQRIWESRRHLFGVIGLARTIWWDLGDLPELHPICNVASISFLTDGATCKTLRYHRAHWLAGLIETGIEATGPQDLGRRALRFG